MTITGVNYHWNFPPNIFHKTFFSCHTQKKAEMSFLRVNDLRLVCIVQIMMRIRRYILLKIFFHLKK